MERTEISNNLKKLREELKLSKAEVAKMIETTRSNLTRWEGGTLPNINYLLQLAELYSVSVDHLVHGKKIDNQDAIPMFQNKSRKRGAFPVLYVDLNERGAIKCEEKFLNMVDIKKELSEQQGIPIIIRQPA